MPSCASYPASKLKHSVEEHIINDYIRRAASAGEEAQNYSKLINTYSLYRLGAFVLFILSVCLAVSFSEPSLILFSLLALGLCFSWLISRQNRFEVLKNYFQDVKSVNENEISSISNMAGIYDNGVWFADEKHNYTADLDIFGQNSLFQLLNRAATFPGNKKLAGWLSTPASKAVIVSRQQAVAEIAAANDWKIDMQADLLFSIKQRPEQIKNLLEYLRIPVDLRDRKWLGIYCKVAPYLLLSAAILAIFYPAARYFAGVIALTNNRLVSSATDSINKTDLVAGRIATTLQRFARAFERIEKQQWASGYLQGLTDRITHTQGGTAVSANVDALSRLIAQLNYRLNLVAGFLLNIFLLWDIRMVIALEHWKDSNQQDLEDAFDVIAEFEALISLASLRINYP